MPRTRTELDRDAKVGEILAAAERRLREGGYEALSMAAIARELGLAQNAVYWYFPSKDHLFVAALERMLRTMVSGKPRGRGLKGKILYFADGLTELADVRAAMYERARSSPVVADFVTGSSAVWRTMLMNALRSHVPDDELPLAADALLATIQGALLQNVDDAERRRIIGYAVDRLVASG
jgi:AcrR family transcriptional regulator